ncbi:DnaA ATPase domain-containing protein [Streptococcus alactolyticus]|uniref:DnaA ATPase domain-containing protein n=1 Tax=Streptococcus alactolyticus TaxID=29389 RepID=UPI00374E7E11
MKPVNKNQTFENFSVNDGNAWALAALKTVIRDKNYYNPVYIYGKEGVGKSHLLNATINAIVGLNKVAFLSAKELSDEIIENVMLSDDNYVIIDDLQLLPKDKALEEKIAMLIEENKKQLVITSTVAPNSMEVSSTLQERLQWGLTTNMTSQNQ